MLMFSTKSGMLMFNTKSEMLMFNTKSEMLMFNTKSEVLIMEKPLSRAVDKEESNLIGVKISNWLLMDD